MNKRLLFLVALVTTLMLTVLNVFADTEGSISETANAAYQAYSDLLDAMESADFDDLSSAIADFNEAYEGIVNDEEGVAIIEFAVLIDETVADATAQEYETETDEEAVGLAAAEAILEFVFGEYAQANFIVELNNYYEAYEQNPDAKSAYEFMLNYETIFVSEEELEDADQETLDYYEEFIEVISDFYIANNIDLEAVYAEASEDAPSENVIEIYENYTLLDFAIENSSVEEIVDVYEDDIEDKLNELTQTELEELEILFSNIFVDSEDIKASIIEEYEYAEVLIELGVPLEAYYYKEFEDYDEETINKLAQEFVDTYEKIFTTNYVDDETKEALKIYFAAYDIETLYEEAKDTLDSENDDNKIEDSTANNTNNKTDNKTDNNTDKKDDAKEDKDSLSSDKDADTGDDLSALYRGIALLVVSAVGFGTLLVLKKKFIKE